MMWGVLGTAPASRIGARTPRSPGVFLLEVRVFVRVSTLQVRATKGAVAIASRASPVAEPGRHQFAQNGASALLEDASLGRSVHQ